MGKEAQVSSAESWAPAREPPAAGRGQGRTPRKGRRGFSPRPQPVLSHRVSRPGAGAVGQERAGEAEWALRAPRHGLGNPRK